MEEDEEEEEVEEDEERKNFCEEIKEIKWTKDGKKGWGVERREGFGYVCEVAAVEGMVGKRERELR